LQIERREIHHFCFESSHVWNAARLTELSEYSSLLYLIPFYVGFFLFVLYFILFIF
jgi:hypothetical protein